MAKENKKSGKLMMRMPLNQSACTTIAAVCSGLFAWSDCTCWTCVNTSSAVNTCVCINYILAIAFADST